MFGLTLGTTQQQSNNFSYNTDLGWSQWACSLRCGSAATCLPGLRVWILWGAWMCLLWLLCVVR